MKIKIKNKLCIFFSLFFIILVSIFLLNKSYSKVEIEKLDKVINWDDQEFYKDAMINLEIAKQIKQESKRRKQLRDQGVPEKEIKEIIKRERKGSSNQNTNTANTTNANNNSNNNYNDNQIANNNNNNNNNNNEIILSNPNQNIEQVNPNFVVNNNTENVNYNNNVSDNQKKHYIEDYFNGSSDDDDEYIVIRKKKNKNNNSANIKNNNDNIINEDEDNVVSGVNDYNNNKRTYKNEKQNYNNYNYKDEDLVPKIPLLASDVKKKLNKNDYKLLKMMEKVGENMYDKEQFELFSKELGRLAREPYEKKQKDNITSEDYKRYSYNYDEEDVLSKTNYNNLETTITNKNMVASKEKKHNFYANSNSIKNSKIKNIKKPRKNLNTQKVYAYTAKKTYQQTDETLKNNINQKDNEFIFNKESSKSTDNLKLRTNSLTEKQLKAKELGSPTPVLRNKKNYQTQIQPQNISQVQYDKNNQHLQPAVFQSQITNNVFSHLSDNNAIEIARAIINQNGYVDITDEKNNTLLMHAVALQNQSLITMLLSEGANPNHINDEGFSPLHLASTNGDNTSLYYLLLSGGNPNLKDKYGITSFMYCAIACNLSTIKMMVSMGANLNEINEINKKSIIDYAVMNKNKDVLEYLTNEMGYIIKKREKSKDLTRL